MKPIIFIPDISGFTKFVQETEISHSQHIVGELLEIIIDNKHPQMQVAEVEGDAVMFYSHKPISPQEIVDTTQTIYKKFHEHLLLYDVARICECGACSSAAALGIKFIGVYGDFNMISVKNQEKPYGAKVILAHKLLKNDLVEKEYLLIHEEEDYLSESIRSKYLHEGSSQYEDLGKIEFKYISLQHLLKEISPVPAYKNPQLSAKPLVLKTQIQSSINTVYNKLSSFDFRNQWNIGVDKIEYDKSSLNKAGSHHLCVINNKNFEFETLKGSNTENKKVYGERLLNPPIVDELYNYFILEDKGEEGVDVTFEIHYHISSFFKRVLFSFAKRSFLKQSEKNIQLFKTLCENGK